MVKIVAFLQNPWFHPGTHKSIITRYTEDQVFHRRVLGMSMTGKRLRQAFGELYDKIWWDNANPTPAFHSAGMKEPDQAHIYRVLNTQEPHLVLTFGRKAEAALREYDLLDVMSCHHPNARSKTFSELRDFALSVMDRIKYSGVVLV